MQKKEKSRGAQRRFRLFLAVVGSFTLWAGFTLWEQHSALSDKKSELKQLQQDLAEEQRLNKEHQQEVTRLHDGEYIEQKVRKEYGMTRPGDKVFQETPQ
jgi:cell division protein DivIC